MTIRWVLFQFFSDRGFEVGAVVLVEEMGKDRTAVDATATLTSTGVKGAVGFAEEVGLSTGGNRRCADRPLPPSKSRSIPATNSRLHLGIVAELDGVVKLMGDGHAQGV